MSARFVPTVREGLNDYLDQQDDRKIDSDVPLDGWTISAIEEHVEADRRACIIEGFYPDRPGKRRMPIDVHCALLNEIDATDEEWRPFQVRNDLLQGYHPVTGDVLTPEEHVEALETMNLTSQDRFDFAYWRSLERVYGE